MLILDNRVGSRELAPLLTRLGVKVELTTLPFGDAAFDGNGPTGPLSIGLERKTLHDMLACIEDARYTGHQRVGMAQLYSVCFLIIEGLWYPHAENGLIMQGFTTRENTFQWGACRSGRQKVMYSHLRRYLFSVSLSGVHVLYTRDAFQTAYDIHDAYHYFRKPWKDHTSLLALQKLAIPTLNGKPSLARKWANDLEDVGTTLSERAERHFKTPLALALADEQQWTQIEGIGLPTAQRIVRSIRGVREVRKRGGS